MPKSKPARPALAEPKLLTPQQASAWIAERLGITLRAETVRLWIVSGQRTPAGTTVRLRSWWIGGRHYTRRRWLREFFQATSEARIPLPAPVTAETETQDEQAKRFAREQERLQARLKRRK